MTYNLKCFGCNFKFSNKKQVERYEGKPYCRGCISHIYISLAERDYFEEDTRSDQERIDEANIARFGEC